MVDSKNLTDEELAEKQEFDENDRREAAEVDNCEYLINPDPYDEHSFLLSYAHKDGWTWMKHPDNPFKIKDMMRWKQKAEKLDVIVQWLLDKNFQEFRDNIPDHADYPRFGDFYEVHSEWAGDFLEWLEKCPMRSEAILGKTKE